MTNRRTALAGLAAAAASLLSSCGTILYPDRAYQKQRGAIDPSIVILDGIGLFFFVIPGLVAFAVDFTTGAIYFPADHEPGEPERMLFDEYKSDAKLDRTEIERVVEARTGQPVDLARIDVEAVPLGTLNDFWTAYAGRYA